MQGGVGDFTQELGTALGGLGHEVHVITRVGDDVDEAQGAGRTSVIPGETPTTQHATPLTIHRIVPHWGWRSYGRVMEHARRLRLDVLNIQYQAAAYDLHPAICFFPLLASGPLRRRARSLRHPPFVVTFHDLKVPYLFPKSGRLRRWVVTLLARQADAAIVTNGADELALRARCVGRVERIPIGSNILPHLPHDYDRVSWRAQWGVMPDDFLLGFFGFFNARKGIETLIKALATLGPPYHLLFIGGTVGSSDATNRAYAERVTTLIANLGLSNRVHYTGYVPAAEVSAAFAAIDLCVLPYADGISFHHGTLMAALAHGQPLVSTQPALAVPELVHGENVWLVPPEDADALSAAITALAAAPGRRRRLAAGAAALSAQFSWEQIAARKADIFASLTR
jgi:glycosyltransferase involved in cell wall biosynthesis